MALPTKSDITKAIETAGSLQVPFLKNFTPVEGIVGPESYCGGFCIVFPFSKNKEKKAVRIWFDEIENIRERYRILSAELNKSKIKSLVRIDYIEKGLKVGGEDIDLTVMDWIEGKSLKDYISSIIESSYSDIHKKEKILNLAKNLEDVFEDMHKKRFSHGDLHHDNIIIDKNGYPFFIDYDCFYTPSMRKNYYQSTEGYDGYQHPSRFKKKYISNEKADYFSELIIILSLYAISNDFSLWTNVDESDYSLIFLKKDFECLNKSKVWHKIKSQGDEICNELLNVLELYLERDSIDDLEPYTEIIDQQNITFTSNKSIIKHGASVVINWEVKKCKELLVLSDKKLLSRANLKGSITVSPQKTTKYYLKIIYENGRETCLPLKIEVFPEASGNFTSDKKYVFPTVPFSLQWSILNADEVYLNGKEVAHRDNVIIQNGIETDSKYVLTIVDKFGKKDLELTIKVLPLPQIKTILVPAPDIKRNVGIIYQAPRFNVTVPTPTFTSVFSKLKLPKIPPLKDSAYFVYCKEPKKRNTNIIKTIFSYFFSKN